jgi:Zn-dependent protease
MTACPACGTHVAPSLLACPGCQQLLHADTLKDLAAEAEVAAQEGDLSAALAAWRRAQPLLPAGSRQARAVAERIEELVRALDRGEGRPRPARQTTEEAGDAPAAAPERKGVLAAVSAAVVFVLTKAKILLLGLGKLSTFASMLLSIGVYWEFFGWWFAIGLVLSIYVHEMGHVVALRRLGLNATAPMFIPGFGALIRLKAYPPTPVEDARIGLAGPMWGLGAALVSLGLWLATGWEGFAAIAKFGAWMNLFNLTPVWQLDGSRGWRALGRVERWVVALVALGGFFLVHEGMLLLVGGAALFRAFGRATPGVRDGRAFVEFLFLLLALTALVALPVQGV